MNYYVIILGVIVIFLLYFLYKNYIAKSAVLNPLVKIDSKYVPISYNDLVKRDSYRYNYSLWVYVNSWTSTNIKTLLSRKQNTGSDSPAGADFIIYLDKTTPTLKCKLYNEVVSSSPTQNESDIVITNNFPIQKWTHVIVSVDNQIIDLYLDGKLVLSRKIEFIPKRSEGDIYLGDGKPNDTFLANVIRNPHPMDPQTAWNNYLSGNGQNNNSNLNIKLAVLQDNIEQKKFTLF